MSQTPPITATFQHILDSAEQLIREKGCRQTTMQDIIERSGLSKGAIYHYVSAKDELFGLILKSKVQAMNVSFQDAVSDPATRDAVNPIQSIAKGMMENTDNGDVSNKIFIYLLSQMDNPKVAEILVGLYRYSLATARQWIEVGQRHGAIPSSIDASKMASMFMIFTYGLRVQRMLDADVEGKLEAADIFQFMFRSLQ